MDIAAEYEKQVRVAQQRLAYFDRLPKALRQALNSAAIKIDSEHALRTYQAWRAEMGGAMAQRHLVRSIQAHPDTRPVTARQRRRPRSPQSLKICPAVPETAR